MDQTLWIGLAFLLTLLAFSYLLGDNFLFRLVTYLFVGVSAGYVFVLAGAICTLVYFQFSAKSPDPSQPGGPARRGVPVESLARIGQVFIGITLGALFAGVYASALTALMERIGFLFTEIVKFTVGG